MRARTAGAQPVSVARACANVAASVPSWLASAATIRALLLRIVV